MQNDSIQSTGHTGAPNSSLDHTFDTNTTVRRWKEATAHLDSSVQAYLKACFALQAHSHAVSSFPELMADTIDRIDYRIGPSHVSTDRMIEQARSSMAITRNALASKPCSLPDEVLSLIFSYVIYEPTSTPAAELVIRMKQHMKITWQHLVKLLAVCSSWRWTLLSNSSFWTLVPITCGEKAGSTLTRVKQCLQRSRSAPLHLAIYIEKPHYPTLHENLFAMSKNWPQVQSVNVCSGAIQSLRLIIRALLGRASLEHIKELSICYDNNLLPTTTIPGEAYYLFTHDSGQQAFLEILIESLHTLRLGKINIHLNNLRFQGLVELRIQEIMLGYDSDLRQLLHALSFAPTLRSLQLISIVTRPDPITIAGVANSGAVTLQSPCSLRNLQILELHDLYFDAIRLTLALDTPHTNRITLHLTEKCLIINNDNRTSRILAEFGSMLTEVGARIDTLIISGKNSDWIGGASGLRQILLGMPMLKTLYLHWWELDRNALDTLTRPQQNSTHCAANSKSQTFPSFEIVYLTGAKLHDPQRFKKFVVSHPIKRLVIGCAQPSLTPKDEGKEWTSLKDSDVISIWLKETVPGFQLLDYGDLVPQLDPWTWRLW